MVDVTVHPRLFHDRAGNVIVGKIIDSIEVLRADAAEGVADVAGAYCHGCGEAVDARALARAAVEQDPPNGGGANR
jgi:alpha/beta superfamily hydrolase